MTALTDDERKAALEAFLRNYKLPMVSNDRTLKHIEARQDAVGYDWRQWLAACEYMKAAHGESKRATTLVNGCVVLMSSRSGVPGYGNAQCVQEVCAELGTISLYGHNQHYKIYDVEKVLEYPLLPQPPAVGAK